MQRSERQNLNWIGLLVGSIVDVGKNLRCGGERSIKEAGDDHDACRRSYLAAVACVDSLQTSRPHESIRNTAALRSANAALSEAGGMVGKIFAVGDNRYLVIRSQVVRRTGRTYFRSRSRFYRWRARTMTNSELKAGQAAVRKFIDDAGYGSYVGNDLCRDLPLPYSRLRRKRAMANWTNKEGTGPISIWNEAALPRHALKAINNRTSKLGISKRRISLRRLHRMVELQNRVSRHEIYSVMTTTNVTHGQRAPAWAIELREMLGVLIIRQEIETMATKETLDAQRT